MNQSPRTVPDLANTVFIGMGQKRRGSVLKQVRQCKGIGPVPASRYRKAL
jgi:hypothetical protein